jgi:hypothetical protein
MPRLVLVGKLDVVVSLAFVPGARSGQTLSALEADGVGLSVDDDLWRLTSSVRCPGNV